MGDGTLVSRGRRRFVKVASSLEISLVFDYSVKVNDCIPSLAASAINLAAVRDPNPIFSDTATAKSHQS